MSYYQKYLKYKNKYIELKKEVSQEDKLLSNNMTNQDVQSVNLLQLKDPEEYSDLFGTIKTNNIIENDKKEKLFGGSKTEESWHYIIDNLRKILNTEGLSVKISELSDPFVPGLYDSDYGGVIFWHNKGNKEIIHGANAITVIIQDTKKWKPEDFGAPGNGIVHNKLYKDLFGESLHNIGPSTAACFSGFSFIFNDVISKWVVKFSSLFANSNTIWTSSIPNCNNNESKMTTNGEATAIVGAVNQWITNGLGSEIPLTHIPVEWEGTQILNDKYQWVLHDFDKNYPYEPSRWPQQIVDPDPDAPRCP